MLCIDRRLAAVVLMVLASPCVSVSMGEDWANYRGPRHDGISGEKGLRTKWSEPIPFRWERNVGTSYSSFACVGDRVYTCGEADDQQALFCLNGDTGEVVWTSPIAPAFRNSYGDGPRATPTVDDGRVYILGGHGRLVCFDAHSGSELWSHKFDKAPTWGYSGSVLIEGDLAISSGGGDHGAIVAFDKKTGKGAWKCGNDPAGYGTPYPFDFEGVRFIAVFTGNSVVIANPKTGKQVGRIPWKTAWDVNAASPIFHDGHLFVTSGYKTGSGLFKVAENGAGLTFTSVWKSKVLLNKFQSPILHQGKLYSSDQKAFKCVDFMTGKQEWVQRRLTHGTLVLAEGYLYFLAEDGELQIGQASPNGFEPETKAKILSGRCWSASVLHRGRIYARNLERLVCLDLKP